MFEFAADPLRPTARVSHLEERGRERGPDELVSARCEEQREPRPRRRVAHPDPNSCALDAERGPNWNRKLDALEQHLDRKYR